MAPIPEMPVLARPDVVALVETSLGRGRANVSDMLEAITKALAGFGCVLWEVVPGADPNADPRDAHLFVLAAWFPTDNIFAMHDLPLSGTPTGSVVLGRGPVLQNGGLGDQAGGRHPFWDQHQVTRMCSAALTVLDGNRGALNVYRTTSAPPFEPQDLEGLERFATLVPALYQAIRDKLGFELVRTVDDILHQTEVGPADCPLPKDEQQRVLRRICEKVAQTFHCFEASVFLEDRLEAPGPYALQATTWPLPVTKDRYSRSAAEGLTGWVLEHGRPMKVFDLAHFDRDRPAIQREYPGAEWKDSLNLHSLNIQAVAREWLGLGTNEELPPLSFMAVPIVAPGGILGVLRCAMARSGPYYFSDREVNLLEPVAAQIGRCWSTWLGRREVHEENQSWQALVKSTSDLNSFVQHELAKTEPEEEGIFAEALRLTAFAVRSSDILDVALLDPVARELYFASTYGDAWQRGSPEQVEARRQRRFPVTGMIPRSAAAHVFLTGELYVMPDLTRAKYYTPTFPDATWMVIAPIQVEEEVFGVLEIRGTQGKLPRPARQVAELMGRQLGLYHHLVKSIGMLRKAHQESRSNLQEIKRLQTEQTRSFEDLAHQLKGPIAQAQKRAAQALDELGDSRNLLAIRGLCRKARRVAMTAGLLEALSRNKPIPIEEETPLEYGRLVRTLIEAAQDTELAVEPARKLRFTVQRESFGPSMLSRVRVDYDLLEQAVNNLLDNAAKYSFDGTEVAIYGVAPTTGKRYHIAVKNVGLRIRPGDLQKCGQRGWRSREARWVTGEGSGLGLWIVNHIMKAHGGELLIVPTTAEGETEVRLAFPISP